jgi:hypothetical protein
VIIGADQRSSVNGRKFLCQANHDNFIRPTQLKPVSHYLINVMDDNNDDNDISIESDYGSEIDNNNNINTTPPTTTTTTNNNNNNNTRKVLKRNIIRLEKVASGTNHKVKQMEKQSSNDQEGAATLLM